VGETMPQLPVQFNGSLRISGRPEQLTGEAGAVLVREALDRLGTVERLCKTLVDPRAQDQITHPFSELVRTTLLLLAQGWRDQDDADAMRHDPALRLSASDRQGTSPLERRPSVAGEVLPRNPTVPDGLASQPTLSRLYRALSTEENRTALRAELLSTAAHRLRASREGHRPRYLTIDVDSMPIEVEGHQEGAEYNGHYHGYIYHPLVATCAELGDLLDLELRPGTTHTAEGAEDFVLPLLDRVEKELCQVAAVRLDAGFPEEKLLSALENRAQPVGYVARVKNNRRLDEMAGPYLRRPVGRPPDEPRTWFHELTYQAKSWSKARRVVLVVQEVPDNLFLNWFWLITNWSVDQIDGRTLLKTYRQRGTAEGHLGELTSVLAPALSSTTRQKEHYRHHSPQKRTPPGNPFAVNAVILLLNALAYNVTHAVRTVVEHATGEGWSLKRVRERVLRVAGRLLVHSRRATLVLSQEVAAIWHGVWSKLGALQLTP
jgi:hypothetical protein